MSKNKLTKGGFSLGTIDKKAMPDLKSNLSSNEKRTTIYLDADLYRTVKSYAVINNTTLKDYINTLIRTDLEKKGYK